MPPPKIKILLTQLLIISSRLLFDKLSDYQIFKEYPTPWSK